MIPGSASSSPRCRVWAYGPTENADPHLGGPAGKTIDQVLPIATVLMGEILALGRATTRPVDDPALAELLDPGDHPRVTAPDTYRVENLLNQPPSAWPIQVPGHERHHAKESAGPPPA